MSNEFYNYIANHTINYFQKSKSTLSRGERFCLKLDNEELVKGVDEALRRKTLLNNIQGEYTFKNVYSTFTIKLDFDQEIVVASKINGMTDDFLATLRNTDLTDQHFPILMITYSTIDTITSGTADLSSSGMPFHVSSIIARIKDDIKHAQLTTVEKKLLEMELKRKQGDRFSDKSSLFEYSNILTVLEKGVIKDEDYPHFLLIPDPEGRHFESDKVIKKRLEENTKYFRQIDSAFKSGTIEDSLGNDYDRTFILYLQRCKKEGTEWFLKTTFQQVITSRDRMSNAANDSLNITTDSFEIYSGSPLEYSFCIGENAFIREDGTTKAKQRRKNILIFNPEKKDNINISINTNVRVKETWLENPRGLSVKLGSRNVLISMNSSGICFAKLTINDLNSKNKHSIRICVIDIPSNYLEEIQTSYILKVPSTLAKSTIQVLGISEQLIINPGHTDFVDDIVKDGNEYTCSFNNTLRLHINDDGINTDTGKLNCKLRIGSIIIPLEIQDESIRPSELTGPAAFIWKYENKKNLEYRAGNKIIAGTTEFYAKDAFKAALEKEELVVRKEYLALEETIDEIKEYPLRISDHVRMAYIYLIETYRKYRTLPSLGYLGLGSPLYEVAKNYVDAIEKEFSIIQPGQTLSSEISDTLLLGCVIKNYGNQSISMTPLHPLNIMYQLKLSEEDNVGNIKESLVEKLTSLYLLPYIKDKNRTLYHAIEQKHSPEWRYYVPIVNNRYQGAGNFVQKLVIDKIEQYIGHFPFLFDEIGNNQITINLINVGDCREIFQGLVKYYGTGLKNGNDPEELLHFVINIYAELGSNNEFHLLSDSYRLKEYLINSFRENEFDDINELSLALTSNISCYYRNQNLPEYEYSHLAFYEMASSEDSGASHMDLITTGISLDGLVSGVPSVLNEEWYKTGFGTKYAGDNSLIRLAIYYNALFRIAFSGSSYEPKSSIFTEIDQGQEGQLMKICRSSNWVVFINPKVDLSFFKKLGEQEDNLMIIHYSDQYTSSSGYDDITVTQKSNQYNEIIIEHLKKKGVDVSRQQVGEIINMFNAINGGWLLKLITAKRQMGAFDSNFSREKMSIISAIKLCMAYYSHNDIVWIPISLEEMLRVSGGAGLSQKDGILSARNLGFEHGATSDDLLMVGIAGSQSSIKVFIHPVEVKIGLNPNNVIKKAKEQVRRTFSGFWNALLPDEGKDDLERKLIRNFFIQLVIASCEKLKLYNIYSDETWDQVLDTYRYELLNDNYELSHELDSFIGIGSVISFGTDILNISGTIEDDICLLELPERLGAAYMVLSAKDIETELRHYKRELPNRLYKYNLETGNYLNSEETGSVTDDINTTSIIDYRREVAVSSVADEKDRYSENNIIEPVVEETNAINQDTEDNQNVTQDTHFETDQHDNGMKIIFGRDVESGNEIIWWPNDTNQVFHTNTGIIGTMGTGKTQFTKSLITQLILEQRNNYAGKPIGILIFDYKGDYNESKADFVNTVKPTIIRPYHLPFNPLSLTKSKVFKPLLPIHTANAFKDTLAKIYGLGPKQQNTLFQCIIDSYAMKGIQPGNPSSWDREPPTFNHVYSRYISDEDIKKSDSLAAAMDKLSLFEIFEGDPSKTVSLYDLLNGVVVIDLSGYDPDIQSLIVAITLDLFYAQMHATGSSELNQNIRQLTKFILVDEADHFMSEGFSSLKKILKEGREFGVGTILSTQFLKHFGNGEDDYSKYILTWVVHNVADLKLSDVDFVFKTESKGLESQHLFKDIKALGKHHSIVKIGNNRPYYIEDLAFWQIYRNIHNDL